MKTDNELIAEFMGIDFTAKDAYLTYPPPICKRFGQYDRSWDWLMPVLEKIEQFKFDDGELDEDDEPDAAFLRTFKGGMVRINRFSLHHHETKLQAAHAAVVEFIKWYNSQNQ